MAKKKTDGGAIQLTRLEDAVLDIPIKGLTPVIPHKWSEKSRRMMPGHPSAEGKVKKTKDARDSQKEAEDCLYRISTGKGKDSVAMPATAFKAAIVDACRYFSEPSMVEAKQLIFVEGHGAENLVPLSHGEKELREDLPRNANGNCDLRYRYYIHDWAATLRVRFVAERITDEAVIALVDAAGRGGVGDWRPSSPKSKTGTYGTWRIDDSKEVKRVREK